jgi:hypothetical protein
MEKLGVSSETLRKLSNICAKTVVEYSDDDSSEGYSLYQQWVIFRVRDLLAVSQTDSRISWQSASKRLLAPKNRASLSKKAYAQDCQQLPGSSLTEILVKAG